MGNWYFDVFKEPTVRDCKLAPLSKAERIDNLKRDIAMYGRVADRATNEADRLVNLERVRIRQENLFKLIAA